MRLPLGGVDVRMHKVESLYRLVRHLNHNDAAISTGVV